MAWRLTEQLAGKINHYSQFPATPVSLRQMVQFGQRPSAGSLFRGAQFICEELPIRLAHRVKELNNLPDGLSDMPSIQKVRNWYAQSFEELTEFPRPAISRELKQALLEAQRASTSLYAENTVNPLDEQPAARNGHNNHRRYFALVDPGIRWPPEIYQYNQDITKCLTKIKRRHDGVVTTVAQGINEYKHSRGRMQIDHTIQAFLDRFYMSRIGIRMLLGQHIAINSEPVHENYVGVVCTKTNVRELAIEAIENARFICEDYYGLFKAPVVQLVCEPDLNFMYVPGHLSHMLFEILKNSLRAVVEKYGSSADEFPPVKLIVAEGNEDITIKISDEGGGIPRSAIPLVWTYMYTTVQSTPSLDPNFQETDFKAPMAGFGYGLPISRLYARYFGGDLKLISMEGYGTDVYLHLNRLSSNSEPLQ
ncbi:mitochondrial branched-chain alpha-ketoacid dehydrogenase kinase-domain-containing protein [Dipodascopsis tothii]|uniref:mitochondrial branched-chain alpha-ketoacid dehydrogenase kinase-domain-containing protein n=1 Tax=Dipodascopsis tothii TaxID=44089 RepID=UPI0034CDE0B5